MRQTICIFDAVGIPYISSIAVDLCVLSMDIACEKIRNMNELIGKVLNSVHALSKESDHVLMFIDGTVMEDYNKLEMLAENYKSDAGYYAERSSELGVSAKEVSASIQNITSIFDTLSEAQNELSKVFENINDNLQQIAYFSENVSAEADEVLDSIELLQGTMGRFHV